MILNEEISKQSILDGLNTGKIVIINNPNDNCISARINDYWFYFCGNEDENLSVDEYLASYTKSEITDMIYNAINDEPIKGRTEDDSTEWLYYKYILEGR